MKYTKIRHFWEWFERHHQSFLDFDCLTRTERQYWLAELQGHLSSYNRFLVAQLQWSHSGPPKQCILTISAVGRASSFTMVDRLLKQAPEIRSWEIVGLQPSAGFDDTAHEMMEQLKGAIGKLWFDKRNLESEGRVPLHVFAQTGDRLEYEHIGKVTDLTYHMLGERLYGMNLAGICLQRYLLVPEEDRSFLVALEKLPIHILARDLPGMTVGKNGCLQHK